MLAQAAAQCKILTNRATSTAFRILRTIRLLAWLPYDQSWHRGKTKQASV